jgi:flagellar M-ring protein FliF
MEQLKKLYRALSPGQRSGIVAAVAVTLAALGLLRWQAAANFKPLYTSLSPEDAGAVVEKLKERSVAYEIADNGATILVPSESVAESRLEMALSGLPKSGRIGFELFDRTNLGVTDFAEHINYQRALEGELERSVMSLTEVEQARVHITLAKDSVFTQSREPAKASVLLKLRPGVTLAPRSVVAISHLVAAAVEGLTPPAVSVVDMNGNLLSSPKTHGLTDTAESTDSFMEYRQSLEKSLVDKINETLEPMLGPGRFRAGVSVECDFTHSEQNEELFNPEQSVVTSSHVTEESTGGPGGGGGSAAGGIPGTASALPHPRPESGPAGNGVSRRSENTTYQASRTVRHTTTPQGGVKKISAAVLVDYVLESQGEGDKQTRKLLARAPEKMDAIRELVSAAIGLDPKRGDQLIVQTMPFETTLQLQNQDLQLTAPGADPSASQKILDRLQHEPMLMVAAGAAVLLLLGAAAWIMRRSRKKPAATLQKGPPALTAASASGSSPGELGEQGGTARVAQPHAAGDLAAARAMQLPQLLSPRHDVLVREVHEIVNKDTELSAGIIHGWLVEEAQQ